MKKAWLFASVVVGLSFMSGHYFGYKDGIKDVLRKLIYTGPLTFVRHH